VSLAQTEPMIAKNHLLATQARAQAEAGFERAVWALSQGAIAKATPPTAIPAYAIDPDQLGPIEPSDAPAPYNGIEYVISGTTGGFTVKVTRQPGMGKNEREVLATGYAPRNTGPTRSHRVIQATVWKLPDLGGDTPCALCVRGDVGVGGNSSVDGTSDVSCGSKLGALSVGTLTPSGSASIQGLQGTPTPLPNEPGSDYKDGSTGSTASSLDGITLSSNDFKALRELAKANGTYFGPGYPDGTAAPSPAWTGSVAFNSSHKLKNGIVFIDTVSGKDIPTLIADQTPSDFANAVIDGQPFKGDPKIPGDKDFKGWIVVNGSLAISGDMKINGLVYTVNDFTYNGTGTGEIRGLAVSQNIRDTSETAISTVVDPDSTTTGNSRVRFDCAATRSPEYIAQNFRLKPGTYREVTD